MSNHCGLSHGLEAWKSEIKGAAEVMSVSGEPPASGFAGGSFLLSSCGLVG